MQKLLIKYGIYAIAGIILIALLFIGFKKIKSLFSGSGDYINDLEDESKGISPTMSDTQASATATALWSALSDFWVDEPTIYRKLQSVQNIADWALLNRKFGIKSISGNISTSLKRGNLNEWLADRLDADEFQKASSILAQKGITI